MTEKTISKIPKNKKKQKNKETTHKPIAGWRLRLFRVIAITIIPTLLFLLLEIILRVVGYGFPTAAIVKCKINGENYYRNNTKFAQRFFPPNIARETNPYIFPADKSDNTYRIFVMGSSAAAGTPDGSFCFGRILQSMLSQQYPQANIEVTTTAMPAINSHVVLEIVKNCSHHQPDLFIVYMGNNEVIGPYGAGTVFAPLSKNLSFIRFDMVFKATRTGQILTNLIRSLDLQKNTPKIWRGLEMFLEKQIQANDPRLETVYQHFHRNLEDIGFIAFKSKTKIIFCTVGSNLKDSPPFSSLHRLDLTETELKNWNTIYQQGIEYETAGDYIKALEKYLKATEVDGCYADLQFRIGRCLWTTGEYEKAKEKFVLARDLDTLRFRADTRINQTIRDIAENKTADGIYLVDAISTFEKNSPNKIPGEELFYEHVHMNFTGNYLLAEAIFKQIEKILPERITRYKAALLQIPAETECAQFLAYTNWDRNKIAQEVLNSYIKQAPFTNQLYHDQRVTRMEQQLKTLKALLTPEVLNEVQAQYRWAIQHNPSDWWLHWKYGQFLEELGSNSAAEQYSLVLNIVPHCYEAHAKLGLLAGKQGNLDAAITNNLEAIRINPIYADAHFNLGLAYQLQNRLDNAIEHYSKAIQFKPDYAQAYNNLAVVLFQQGKISHAEKIYRDGLKLVPDDLDLHYNLGLTLEKQGRRDEAIKELRAALQIDPNSIKTHKVLDAILKIPSTKQNPGETRGLP